MTSPRDVIESIRKKKYGLGLPPKAPERVGFDALRPILDQAISHLSDDLYAKDVHFILELIQNADDNRYHPKQSPTLRFIRQKDRLIVTNNEIGFDQAHAEAICSIGASRKTRAKGHIGEKGIGFKSVFRVSDSPHIVSNGFSFRFQRRDLATGLGFIVPEWVEAIPDGIDLEQTNIILPLRPDVAIDELLSKSFDATMLLFLEKLTAIEYQDDVQGVLRRYRRATHEDGVTLHSENGHQNWRLVQSTIAVPSSLLEQKRQGIHHSKIALGFPLTFDGKADVSCKRDVFAFLPVRPYGFSFVIQADFILSSSREAILENRAWNIWLKESLVCLFLEAVASFRSAEGALQKTFLNFIPDKRPHGFFADVLPQILARLSHMECVLTFSGRWTEPAKVFHAKPELAQVLANDDVKAVFGREYAAFDFQLPPALRQALGIPSFGVAEWLKFLANDQILRRQSDSWFTLLFSALSRLDLEDDLEHFKKLCIIPLSDGSLAAAASDRRLFLPLTKASSYGFEPMLPLVRASIFDGAPEDLRLAALRFLRRLGVKKAAPADLIADYILPLFEGDADSPNWKKMHDEFRIGSVEYIKDHLKEYCLAGQPLARLAQSLFLKFIHPKGHWYVKPDQLYLGEAYGNARLEELLQGAEECRFVHPIYLERSTKRALTALAKPPSTAGLGALRTEHQKAWRAFFTEIGLSESFRIVVRASESELDQASCPDLEKLLEGQDPQRIAKAAHLLDEHWSYYRHFLHTELRSKLRHPHYASGTRRTQFAETLAATAWLADTQGVLRRPGELFLDTPRARDILGDDVSYLGVVFQNPHIEKDLGIQLEPNVGAALNRLRHFAQRGALDLDEVAKIYRFLDQGFDSHAATIRAAFANSPLCLAAGLATTFVSSQRVFWLDPGFAFQRRRGFLAAHWPAFKDFFVQKLQIALAPSPRDYAALLLEMAREGTVHPPQEKALWLIYCELESWCKAQPTSLTLHTAWWQETMGSKVFWTEDGQFRANDGQLFVDDHEEFHQLFHDAPKISFLKIPRHQHPLIGRFLEQAKIPLLSKAVHISHVNGQHLRKEAALSTRCREVLPYLLRYLYFEEHPLYASLEAKGFLARLQELEIWTCRKLEVTITLGSSSRRCERAIASQDAAIFMTESTARDLDCLAIEWAKLIGGSDSLGLFIAAVLAKADRDGIERFLRAKGIPPLPSTDGIWDEARWELGPDHQPADDLAGDSAREPAAAAAAAVRDESAQEDALPTPAPSPHRQLPCPDLSPRDIASPAPFARATPIGHVRPSDAPMAPPEAWVARACAGQTSAPMTSVTPRSAADIPRHFGERPGGPSGAAHDDHDESLSNRHPQSRAIGRWGEECAFGALVRELSVKFPRARRKQKEGRVHFELAGQIIAEVHWLNWQEDRGVGFDIALREDGEEYYIEVKATADGAKASFEITAAEWECARRGGPRYRIFRLYHAGTAQARIDVLCDPHTLWREGKLSARPVRIEL